MRDSEQYAAGSRACKDVQLACFLPPSEGFKVSLTKTHQ